LPHWTLIPVNSALGGAINSGYSALPMRLPRELLLTHLLSQPTAPFRESHIQRVAAQVLDAASVPWFTDPIGNIVVGAHSRTDYYRCLERASAREPLRLFIAHMDHPGFHGTRWLSGKRLAVAWHGGSPTLGVNGARVWVANRNGYLATGRLARAHLAKSGWSIERAEVILDHPLKPRPSARDLFGGFEFNAPVWRSGKRLYTKAADDLVGVFAILSTAIDLFRRGNRSGPPFLGLLTRGEEVGFVGAVSHFELGWLKNVRRPLVCVSLETSRTLAGAIIGKGPVVRLGDRRTVFDPDGLRVLSEVAERVLPGKHQRRVMDGGACEATAATAYGVPAIGLSVPLGNYHNQNLEGGPQTRRHGGAAPEFVDVRDIGGLLKLCRALMRPGLPWNDAWHEQRERLKRNLRRYARQI